MLKSTFFMALASALALQSCTNERQIAKQTEQYRFQNVAPAEVPNRVRNHALATFPGSSVLRASQNPIMGYELQLNNSWEMYYNMAGDFVYKEYDERDDDRPIPVSSLPQNVRDYIATNYPNATILWAEVDDDEYEVTLSDGTELYFDLRGRFIKAEMDDVPVNPADLPASILSYIQTNFPNAQIQRAMRDANYYEVYLDNGVELYFSLAGVFIGQDVDDMPVNINNLPASIINYVSQNYPNITIVSAEIDDNMYEIELSNGTELYFDLNGNFLYADFD
jgi:hypothetical protein